MYSWLCLSYYPALSTSGIHLDSLLRQRSRNILRKSNERSRRIWRSGSVLWIRPPLFWTTVFGQSVVNIIGYQNSFDLPDYLDAQTFETSFFVPRFLTGILAVFDTFLIYKISERRYNATVGFIAGYTFCGNANNLAYKMDSP